MASILFIIKLTIILWLAIRLILINKEVKNIDEQLQETMKNGKRKRLRISIFNKNLESLSSSINSYLYNQEEEKINIKKQEVALKESIANISHDLRTPLTSILGYITIMKEDASIEYLDAIEGRATRLKHLINEFYELSIIDDEGYDIEKETIDIVAVLTEVLIGSFSEFSEKNVKPVIEVPKKAVFTLGNKNLYERIFQNLIGNAIKYTESDVKVSFEEKEGKGIIIISNKTSSISQKDVLHLFDKFYTGDASRNKGGTGLGLYVVKTLCDKMEVEVGAMLAEDEILSIRLVMKIENNDANLA